MGRPKKSAEDKLVPVKTTLTPAQFDALDREARTRAIPLARVIRERLAQSFENPKHKQVAPVAQ